MGLTSSRAVLLSSREPGESISHPKWNLKPVITPDRLVRNQLCQKVQCSVHDPKTVCDRIPLVQESSKSVQQEDVRSLLPVQANQVQGTGHNSRSAELF